MRGMSPIAWFLGISSVLSGMLFAPQGVATSIVNCLRQRPTWMTRGMDGPTGTPVRVNVPSGAVIALTSGSPAPVVPQMSQVMPAGKGWSPGSLGSFGM